MRRANVLLGVAVLLAAVTSAAVRDGHPAEPQAGHATKLGGVQAVDSANPASRPYIGKPRSPVRVQLENGSTPQAGVPSRLLLGVHSPLPLSAVELVVEGDPGLHVAALTRATPGELSRQARAASPPTNEAAVFAVDVVPSSGGLRYLSGAVRFMVDGVAQAAPFRVGVRVAGPVTTPVAEEKPRPAAISDATGDLINSMPAETIVR